MGKMLKKLFAYICLISLILVVFTNIVIADTELDGSWSGTSPQVPGYTWECDISGDSIYFIDPVGDFWGTIKIDESKNPKHIDITITHNSANVYYNGKTSHGIFEINGDTGRIAAYEVGLSTLASTTSIYCNFSILFNSRSLPSENDAGLVEFPTS